MFLSVPTFLYEMKKHLGTASCTFDRSTGWRQVKDAEYVEASFLPSPLKTCYIEG
jgi:hypothetical protein